MSAARRLSWPRRAAGIWIVSLVWVLVAADAARAVPLPEGDEPYTYVAVDRTVGEALSDFSVRTGILVKASEDVDGKLAPRTYETTVRGFLDQLAREFELVWYYDGAVVHVYDADEMVTRMMRLRGVAPQRLARELDTLGIWDARFPIRLDRESSFILAFGPPRYLALVELVLADLANRQEAIRLNMGGEWR